VSRPRLLIALLALAVLVPAAVGATGHAARTYHLKVTLRRTGTALEVTGTVRPRGYDVRRVDVVVKSGAHWLRRRTTRLDDNDSFSVRMNPVPNTRPDAVSVKIGVLHLVHTVG
jgi:hypothetical protein